MNQMPPNRPTGRDVRRVRRALLAALILAWATQLLVTQWSSGALQAGQGNGACAGTGCGHPGVTVKMRSSANTTARISLADICELEWDGIPLLRADGAPIEQMVITEAVAGENRVIVRLEQVLEALLAAGVHDHKILVTGPIRCDVSIRALGGRAAISEQEAGLLAWAQLEPPERSPARPPRAVKSGVAVSDPATIDFAGEYGSLGEMLRRDLARRLRLPLESLQIRFAPEDVGFARRSDIPADRVRPLKVNDLGEVAWGLEINGADHQIRAAAASTLTHAVASRPIRAGQVISTTDVSAVQARITRLAERGVSLREAVGNEAVQDIGAGQTVLPEMLAPRLMVRQGQLVSVEMVRNGVEIRALAKAMEDGRSGQVIRVRSEATAETLYIAVSGPQSGRLVDPPASAEEAVQN